MELAEGDPFSTARSCTLYTRLIGQCPVEVVPGVTGMAGAWTLSGEPITWGDDILCVLPGTLPQEALEAHARNADALVIMKVGRNLAKITTALASAGRLDDAWYIERATMDGSQPKSWPAVLMPRPLFLHCAGARQGAAAAMTQPPGHLYILGLGPGPDSWVTPEVSAILGTVTDIIGYIPYVARVPSARA